MGHNWHEEICLDWQALQRQWIQINPYVEQEEFAEGFKDELGTLKGIKVGLMLKPQAIPKFCKLDHCQLLL